MFESRLAQLRDIEARQRALDAERLAVVYEWVESGEWSDDGSARPAARLARDTALGGQQARERVKVARLLHASMPHTLAAFGALGWPKVRLLANVVDDRTAPAFAAAEPVLVEQAQRFSVDQLAVFLQHWRRLVDQDGANADADAMHERQFVSLAESWQGEGFLTGRLDPESTAIVREALQQVMKELYRADRRDAQVAKLRGEEPPPLRSASQLRAEALVEVARRSMAVTDAEESGARVVPPRPSVTVTIDADDRAALLARLASGAPLSLGDVARMACDAAVVRVVTKRGVVPLELGRTVREPSDAQRRALGAIWSTCAFSGCDRPFAWCDLHHVEHWEDGGRTDVDRLVPLCRRHHTNHHRGMFRIRRRPCGTFVFERPDGTVIGDANPTTSQLVRMLGRLDWTCIPAA